MDLMQRTGQEHSQEILCGMHRTRERRDMQNEGRAKHTERGGSTNKRRRTEGIQRLRCLPMPNKHKYSMICKMQPSCRWALSSSLVAVIHFPSTRAIQSQCSSICDPDIPSVRHRTFQCTCRAHGCLHSEVCIAEGNPYPVVLMTFLGKPGEHLPLLKCSPGGFNNPRGWVGWGLWAIRNT